MARSRCFPRMAFHGLSSRVQPPAISTSSTPRARSSTRFTREGRRYAERGYDVMLIGHEGHAEVEGTRGQIGGRLHVVGTRRDIDRIEVSDPSRVAYITQTTLSLFDTMDVISALKQRFPAAVGQQTKDICYATQNRQNAVLEMAREAQLILVLGSANSSNSNRLREIAEATGVEAHLIDSAGDLDPSWLEGVHTLGLTAGASAPECLVLDTIETLGELRAVTIETMPGVEEAVQFKLPARVAEAARQGWLSACGPRPA